MTRDEFTSYLTDAADPNKAPEALTKIRDGVSELFASSEAAQAQAKKDKATIEELQGVNMRMFLRDTGTGSGARQEQEHEETLDEYNARIGRMIRGEEEPKNGNQ